MELSTIPWRVFFAELSSQPLGALEIWLRHWRFTNEGVLCADPQAPAAAEFLLEEN